MEVEIKVTDAEIRLILDTLSNLPYKAVSGVISKIIVQLNDQISEAEPAQQEE